MKQLLGIATSISRPVPVCSHMNIAIISEQITLQCSIAAGGGSARATCADSSTLPARKLRTPWQLIYVEIRSWHERFL
nr:hypothetical protein [Xanthomonas arboricola]